MFGVMMGSSITINGLMISWKMPDGSVEMILWF